MDFTTVQQMELYKKLSYHNKVYWHWVLEEGMTHEDTRALARTADIYLSSVNGFTDKCYDCKSPDRICRGLSVLWGKPEGCEYEVILIHEKLGY